jgi:hypothetical protein
MKIHNYKPVGKGLVVASLDIEVEQWGITFRSCTLFDKDGKKWISFPSKKSDGPDGKPRYYNYVVMDKEKKEAFDKAAIALIDALGPTVAEVPLQDEYQTW